MIRNTSARAYLRSSACSSIFLCRSLMRSLPSSTTCLPFSSAQRCAHLTFGRSRFPSLLVLFRFHHFPKEFLPGQLINIRGLTCSSGRHFSILASSRSFSSLTELSWSAKEVCTNLSSVSALPIA